MTHKRFFRIIAHSSAIGGLAAALVYQLYYAGDYPELMVALGEKWMGEAFSPQFAVAGGLISFIIALILGIANIAAIWHLYKIVSETEKAQYYETVPSESWKGAHDCAPSALNRVKPLLCKKQITLAFMNCSDMWPSGGVTNKEFNIVLGYLGIKSEFEYIFCDGMTLGKILKDKKNTYIVLLHGHFSVIDMGVVKDSYLFPYDRNSIVHCAWKFLP